MAIEELSNLPPYSEIILASIVALDKKEGSSKAVISKYMELMYVRLSQYYPSLLGAHLTRMEDGGELMIVKSNYLLSSPDEIPVKHGYDHPPKSKPEGLKGKAPSYPKHSHRSPLKHKDPIAVTISKVAEDFVPFKKEPIAKKLDLKPLLLPLHPLEDR